MKIAVATRAIAPLHGHGGLERAVADSCAALAARGHDVTVFTATRTNREAFAPLPFVVIAVPWGQLPLLRRGGVLDRAARYARFTRRLTRAITATNETYDIAIGHGAAAAAFIPLRATGRVHRLLLNPHGMEEFTAPPLKRAMLRGQRALVHRAATVADRVIATDAALVPAVIRNLGTPIARIAVIPNGVNIEAIDRLTPAVAPDLPPIILSVGRIEANKGLDLLAAALGLIAPTLPSDWQWHHVGEGAGRQKLAQAITTAGIGGHDHDHVHLQGALSDATLHACFARATLFVHPARYEGSSLVTLEAMVYQLPVVAAAVGGIPDKVIPGETGWLVPPNDIQALSEAIQEAFAMPESALRAMGMRGRQRVEKHFSLDHSTNLLLALITELVK